jgi:hypothetical protein
VDRETLENRFDHEITGYPLLGAHSTLNCTQCHDGSRTPRDGIDITFAAGTLDNAYPTPTAETCTSCHTDYHNGAFVESLSGPECDACHSQDGWIPTSFGIARHNSGTRFSLDGAHLVVPCLSCHNTESLGETQLQFKFDSANCSSCHAADDPHSTQFAGRECTECHGTESFGIAAFDHSNTRYPLDGAHRDVACEACHFLETDQSGREYRVYIPLGRECIDCHGGYR